MVNFANLGRDDQTPTAQRPAPEQDTAPAQPEREYSGRLLVDEEPSAAAPDAALAHLDATEQTGPFIPGSGAAHHFDFEDEDVGAAPRVQPSVPVTGAPLLTMWLAPRRTIRGVLNQGSFIVVLLLAALAGAASTIFDSFGATTTFRSGCSRSRCL